MLVCDPCRQLQQDQKNLQPFQRENERKSVTLDHALLACPHCGNTDPSQWTWIQYTRVNYAGVRVTNSSVEVEANGSIEYESVIKEQLRCCCGGEIDRQGRAIVYV